MYHLRFGFGLSTLIGSLSLIYLTVFNLLIPFLGEVIGILYLNATLSVTLIWL